MVSLVIFVVCAVLYASTSAKPEYDRNLAEIDSIFSERECLMQGGLCVIEADCPELTASKGLCPIQRSQGVECCYGSSRKETRCQRRGGGCVPSGNCPPQLTFHEAIDCPEESVCCIFVN